uniref:hypothetical protein n=1 Tax=Bacillus altitudinis TaxID=293387 RepID=UPI001C9307D6
KSGNGLLVGRGLGEWKSGELWGRKEKKWDGFIMDDGRFGGDWVWWEVGLIGRFMRERRRVGDMRNWINVGNGSCGLLMNFK